jgi:hypothetical protein
MALTVTSVTDNPSLPASIAQTYLPDQLILDPKTIVTLPITVLTGAATFARGTVLGRITASGKYTISKTSAVDGSQTPAAILADFCDPTAADAQAGAYVMGEFNVNALVLDATWTAATVAPALIPSNIYAKVPVSATDPS